MKCYNCEKPAMFLVGPEEQRVPLCLDCNLKHAQFSAIHCDQLEREMNFAIAQAESVMGMTGALPRYPERQVRIIQGGSVSYHNINVTGSSIGVLNAGNLEMVDSAITVLKNDQTSHEIAKAISNLINAIASSDLPTSNKNEAIEILSVVASEATAPNDKRKTAVAKQLLTHFPTVIQTAASVIQIWQTVGPTITRFFS